MTPLAQGRLLSSFQQKNTALGNNEINNNRSEAIARGGAACIVRGDLHNKKKLSHHWKVVKNDKSRPPEKRARWKNLAQGQEQVSDFARKVVAMRFARGEDSADDKAELRQNDERHDSDAEHAREERAI